MLASRRVQDLPASPTVYNTRALSINRNRRERGLLPPFFEKMWSVSNVQTPVATNQPSPPSVRCAVYARVSVADRQPSEFNSLAAQIDSCSQYIASQREKDWVLVYPPFIDDGLSGANLKRPGLRSLLELVQQGEVEVIVMHRLDRLSRSLFDLTEVLLPLLRVKKVALVSVTEHIDTLSHQGRLSLHLLTSFAEFERELIGERTRDKLSATRRQGRWQGNGTPLGYGVDHEQRLVVLPPEAGLVREIFQRYLACDSSADLMNWFERHGIKTKKWVTRDGKQRGGRPMDRTTLFRILNNRMYIGEALFDGEWHSRIYPPIIALDLWRDVQEKLNRRARRKDIPNEGRSPLEFPLYDKLFWHEGQAYTASKSSLRGKQRYRYYLAPNAAKKPEATGGAVNLPTEFIHQVVIAQLRQHFKSPEPWLPDLREQMKSDGVMDDEAIRQSMLRLDGSWRLFTDFGMANLLFKLVARVTMYPDGAKIQINMDALAGLIKEIGKAGEDAGDS